MAILANAIRNTVSISQFNKGFAGKIFEEVKETGAKLVMKNNHPEAVIMSPEEYLRLVDEVNDARLLIEASQRFANMDRNELISSEDVMKELNITQEVLDSMDDVEIEWIEK